MGLVAIIDGWVCLGLPPFRKMCDGKGYIEIHAPTSHRTGEKWGTRNLPSSPNGVTADLVTFRIRQEVIRMSLSLRPVALGILILSLVAAAPAKQKKDDPLCHSEFCGDS